MGLNSAASPIRESSVDVKVQAERRSPNGFATPRRLRLSLFVVGCGMVLSMNCPKHQQLQQRFYPDPTFRSPATRLLYDTLSTLLISRDQQNRTVSSVFSGVRVIWCLEFVQAAVEKRIYQGRREHSGMPMCLSFCEGRHKEILRFDKSIRRAYYGA